MNTSTIARRVNFAAQLIVFMGFVSAFWYRNWFVGIACIGILMLMNVPLRIRRSVPIPLSPNTRVLMSLLLFAWLFLGELQDYFGQIVWWDLFLHGFAGAVIALVGVRFGNTMTADDSGSLCIRYAFAGAFGFSLAMAVGSLWEVLEFAIDKLFDREILKPMLGDSSGLTDTIFDLVADALGALLACVYGLFRLYRTRVHAHLSRGT